MRVENIEMSMKEVNSKAVELVKNMADDYIYKIEKKFILDFSDPCPPWDVDYSAAGFHCTYGYKLICEFIGNSVFFMFPKGIEKIWKFESGSELHEVIEESFGFEFYVFDEQIEYLMCFNDHDFIVGWGSAAVWLDSISVDHGDPHSRH